MARDKPLGGLTLYRKFFDKNNKSETNNLSDMITNSYKRAVMVINDPNWL